jgi:hypothetical protein
VLPGGDGGRLTCDWSWILERSWVEWGLEVVGRKSLEEME